MTAAAGTEILGGVLLAAGFLSPVASGLIVSVMIVAAVSVHWQHGVFATTNGIEVPLLYATGAIALALTGPGAYSLDELAGLTPVLDDGGWRRCGRDRRARRRRQPHHSPARPANGACLSRRIHDT